MALVDAANRSRTPLSAATGLHNGPNDSIRQTALVGWLIIAAFFGGLGTWAVTAPLNGAVVANAVIKVDGNRKSVQHLDGGIVNELRVREGDRVLAGDLLIVLDETQARAEYDVLTQEYAVLRATEIRLLTELEHGSELVMPPISRLEPRIAISRASGKVNSANSRAGGPRWKGSAA